MTEWRTVQYIRIYPDALLKVVELSEAETKLANVLNGAKRNITVGCTCSACTYLREME